MLIWSYFAHRSVSVTWKQLQANPAHKGNSKEKSVLVKISTIHENLHNACKCHECKNSPKNIGSIPFSFRKTEVLNWQKLFEASFLLSGLRKVHLLQDASHNSLKLDALQKALWLKKQDDKAQNLLEKTRKQRTTIRLL